MNFDRNCLRLYAVTDRAWVGRQTLCQQVEAALQGGATCVQLREKQLDKAAFLAEARQIAALCRRYGAPFIVNDDLGEAIQKAAAVLKAEECRVMRNANCIEETKQAYQ